ncbi:MAG TPA: hypothetical protein PK103_02840 [Elusimicrobiales bacterium]|nr:hypothetical protein [Elusimicrobiales bacterium]
MKKILFFLSFIFLAFFSYAKEYKVDNFVFDFEEGWSEGKGTDPNSVLKLEKSGSYVEFIKLEDELSDFYLNSKLNEQKDALFNKGIKPSDIRTQTIHSVSKIYYFSYDDKKLNIVGLFTYGGVTYNFLSSGISDDSFKKLIYGFRKEGEKIEAQAPKPKPKPKPKPVEKIEKEPKESGVSYISVSDSTSTAVAVSSAETVVSSPAVSEVKPEEKIEVKVSTPEVLNEVKTIPQPDFKRAFSIIEGLLDEISKKSDVKPFIERKPLNKYAMLFVLVVYFLIVFVLKAKFSKYSNPKIKPYPKEMPPDFLFPFIITRVNTSVETLYQIITRNNQFLSVHFNHNYKKLYEAGIYGIIIVHLLWSLGDFVRKGFFQALVVSLPLGNYIISFIELPFVFIVLYSLIMKLKEKQKFSVSDSQMNVICEILNDKNGFIVKDGKGRDVLKVKKTGSYFNRKWEVINEDNQLIMTLKDDSPDIWLWTKILGNKFFGLRCYYSVYAEGDKRIGFLFLDPNSVNGYQVHFDYDYFRLANPIYTVSLFLYVISKEKEESILFI